MPAKKDPPHETEYHLPPLMEAEVEALVKGIVPTRLLTMCEKMLEWKQEQSCGG